MYQKAWWGSAEWSEEHMNTALGDATQSILLFTMSLPKAD